MFTRFVNLNLSFDDKIKNPLAAGVFISRNCCPAPQPSVLCAFSISKSPLNWPLPRTAVSLFMAVMRYAIKHYFIYVFSYTYMYSICSARRKKKQQRKQTACAVPTPLLFMVKLYNQRPWL